MRYTLRYKQHDFDLAEGAFVVGRAETCELSLDDPMVSRNHGRFCVTPVDVRIEDLDSRNGVKVNGERIRKARKLEHGDQIVIGSQEMVLLVRREVVADTLVQPRERGEGFGLLGALADKALGLGRGEEAERLVGQQLDQLLGDVESGRAVSSEQVDRATDYALRIASSTLNARWSDFIFRLYSALRRPCAAPVVDELYTVLRKVQKPSPQVLRTYLGVLRALDLGPADRFLVNRIEGLERLIGAR